MTVRDFMALGAAACTTLALAGCTSVQTGVQKVQHVVSSSPCHETTVTLYFESGSDKLTEDGRQIVSLTAKRLKTCTVTELRLVGLADPAGAPQANIELSQRRADNVLDAFVHAGVPAPKYTMVARGDIGAIQAGGAVEPVRRRVDVVVSVKGRT